MDLSLAILHHFAAFGIVAALSIEVTMLRGTLDGPRLLRLSRVDLFYALAAGLVLLAGIGRVLLGPKGTAFYVGNPVFWIKMALIALIAAMSIAPTLRYLRWARTARTDPLFAPAPGEVAQTRRLVFWQAHLVLFVLVAAAVMARGIGL